MGKADEQKRGKCRLCLQEKELRRSHALSEFLYEPTYERNDTQHPKKGRMLDVPPDTGKRLSYLQKGRRDRLLCGSCEQHLNRIGEQYASDILRKMDETKIHTGERHAVVTGVDYRPFKLFLLAQLWRASVASDSFWKDIRLGPHEERLREMLCQAEPGRPHEYACALTRIPASVGLLSRAVSSPVLTKIEGSTLCDFVARGYSWLYIVSSHSKNACEPWLRLSEKGELPIILDITGSIEEKAAATDCWVREQRRAREGGK